MNRLVPLALAAALASAFVPVRAARAAGETVVLDRVVARVDADTILQSDLLERAAPSLAHGGDRAAVLKKVLEQMIDDDLIARDAARLHIAITDAQVQEAIDAVRAKSKLTKAQLTQLLGTEHLTRALYEGEIRRQLLEYKWLLSKIDPSTKPDDPKESESFVVKQRDAAVAELRRHAFVEVRL